ncbi:phenoloxidase-activating factor 2-like [Drosophila innubila]|uniref:phenoloxidase-activating factor 2-like n=1 Tax=Drosophila innubila TaxID=198719 RepID=UPI00148DE955|nr:phenoloxidase-activating factor 2-like [Drosophila innubila]
MREVLGLIFVLCSCMPSSIRAAEIDLGSEKTALRSKLLQVFDISRQNQILLDDVLNKTFYEIEESIANIPKEDEQLTTDRLATQTEAPAQADQQCGPQRVCVPKEQCRYKTFGKCANDKFCCGVKGSPIYNQNMCGYGIEVTPNRPFQVGAKRQAEITEFPWMIAVFEGEEFIATGVLISGDKVITSASKLDGKNPDKIRVVGGEWTLPDSKQTYPPQRRLVELIILHENFKNNKKYNDIALIQLKMRFSDVEYIKPICLSDSLAGIDLNKCQVTNWGNQNSALRSFSIFPMNANDCENTITKQNINWFGDFIRENVICIRAEPDIKACGVDNGSPLVCPFLKSPQQYTLVGLANCGWKSAQFASNRMPDIYAFAQYFAPWIRTNLNPDLLQNVDVGPKL